MDDKFDLEKEDDPETDYIIDPITGKESSIAYGLYKKMNMYQYHYNSVKVKYKVLAVTWFIASFFGISYIVLGKEVSLPVDKLLAISLLGFFSSIGIFLLCFFDVSVYHRLGESIFAACANFEVRYPKLGKSHRNMAKLLVRGKTSPVIFDGVFYCSLTFVLLLLSDICLYFYLTIISSVLSLVVFYSFLLLVLLLDFFILCSSSKLISAAKKELQDDTSRK